MSSIEIDSNTVIKLLARRGSDLERKNIVLSEGEFGYAVDTKRLYIGDGVTPGGVPTSVKFHNTTANITSIQETVNVNDLVYKSDTKEIYKLVSGTGASLSDWELISSPKNITTDNATLSSTAAGSLFVKEISGIHISSEALGSGLSKSANKVIVSGDINVNTVTALTANINKISTNTASSLTIPNALTFANTVSSTQYTFPLSGQSNNYYLTTDGNGQLSWAPLSAIPVPSPNIPAGDNMPVGSIIFQAASSWTDPEGWLICDGRSVLGTTYPDLSAAIKTTYGGNATHFNLPNLTGGGMLIGAGVKLGSSPTSNIVENIYSQLFPIGYSSVAIAASPENPGYILRKIELGALAAFSVVTPGEDQKLNVARGTAGIWLIKHSRPAAFTAQINVLSSNGLSAYNITTGFSTTSISSGGTYDLSIPQGDIGSGNPAVVRAYNRARYPKMYTFSTPGSAVYTVSDNVYRIKVTATGAGGVGYIRYDTGGGVGLWRAHGTQGGAGSSIIAYIDVEPGEKYVANVGSAGTAAAATDAFTAVPGEGGDTIFSLSAGGGAALLPYLWMGGAYDPVYEDAEPTYYADWSANGTAQGGIRSGRSDRVPGLAKVVSHIIIPGGTGGQFMTNGPSGPGAAGLYGSGPAPGGGGSGYARRDTAGQEIAAAGNGLVIVEEL